MNQLRSDFLPNLLSDFQRKLAVPAVGGAVVTLDDIQVGVVGNCVRGQDREVERDHQWHIGSCAKSMIAALFARLVERGLAEWNMPVATFFPDLAGQLHHEWQARTLDEVLVCQSGMKANLTIAEMKSAYDSTGSAREQRTQVAANTLSLNPAKRERFLYSNLGYIVVAAAIERIAGQTFEDTLTEELLEPLGITSCGIGPPPVLWGHKSRWRIGNLCVGRGKPVDPECPHSDNPAVYTSAGRLHFTLEDWARFQRIFLAGNSGFLKQESIDHLLTMPDGGVMAMGWAPVPALDQISYAMQGSNTFWAATAMMDQNRDRIALVVCNDGRSRVLRAEVGLATDMLAEA